MCNKFVYLFVGLWLIISHFSKWNPIDIQLLLTFIHVPIHCFLSHILLCSFFSYSHFQESIIKYCKRTQYFSVRRHSQKQYYETDNLFYYNSNNAKIKIQPYFTKNPTSLPKTKLITNENTNYPHIKTGNDYMFIKK